jgi:hypothetical protein
VKRKYDYFTGIGMASDEIHIAKVWKNNHQTVGKQIISTFKMES